MIEESVLARSLREKDGRETYSPLLEKAQISLSAIDALLEQNIPLESDLKEHVVEEAQSVQSQLSEAISAVQTGSLLETLLNINDSLLEKLTRANQVDTVSVVGHDLEIDSNTEIRNATEEEIVSPRLDKGKGRAVLESEPEAENFRVGDSDEEEDHPEEMTVSLVGIPAVSPERIGVPSPTERSRMWVEEEGEIFRKGQALLEPADLESEYAGEQLRIELLEAQVERPPQRQITEDEHGEELEPPEAHPDVNSPRVISPVTSPTQQWLFRDRINSFDAV